MVILTRPVIALLHQAVTRQVQPLNAETVSIAIAKVVAEPARIMAEYLNGCKLQEHILMLVLGFEAPKDVITIRDGIQEVCRDVAEEFGLVARFEQPQQVAFKRLSNSQRSSERTGNGNHKDWRIEYQKEPAATPIGWVKLLGRLFIRSPYLPAQRQFGGFSYHGLDGKYPVYPYVTIHTPSELNIKSYSHEHGDFRPLDPNPEMLEVTYAGLKAHFGIVDQPTLFEIEPTGPVAPR